MSDIASVMHAKALGLSLPNDGAVPMGNLSLLEAFARRFLDPEDLGHSVSAYTRDQARVALGRQPVESTFPPLRKTPMTTPDQALESAIVAAGATKAPRIKPADIEANISICYFFTADDALQRYGSNGAPFDGHRSLKLLTFCVLVLKNGFTVTGESACASPENFNRDIGQRIARENAIAKIWPLMGYELRTRIAENRTTIADRSGN